MNEYMTWSQNEKKLKYRYCLIVIIGIIIIILSIFIGVVYKNNKKSVDQASDTEMDQSNEEVLRIALENKQREEEEKERKRQLEKEEEEKATGIIYLTFDDGPSSDSTPQILDILEKKNVKATFFVLHYSEQNEHLIKREYSNGHTVALHGYTHNYSEVYQSADSCIENFKKIQNQVLQTTGFKSNIIRFPGGSSNTISKKYCEGVMTELSQRVIDEGFRVFDWNVDSNDAGHAKNSDAIFENVTTGIKPDRKNVVLMHDFFGNQKTIDALEGIINFGQENGYVFRRITEDTPMVRHAVNN